MGGDFSSAKNYALRLIKFRVRSEKEVRDKLRDRDYSQKIIEEVVSFLKKTKLLDDELFAKLWIQSRVKKPLGFMKLRQELKRKGIDHGIIENQINHAQENYNEEKVINDIILLKMQRMKNLHPDKIKSRLYAYLIRRGFSRGLVIEAILSSLISSGAEEPSL